MSEELGVPPTFNTFSQNSILFYSDNQPVLIIRADGRIFWNGFEVFSQEEFRAAMIELHQTLVTKMFEGVRHEPV